MFELIGVSVTVPNVGVTVKGIYIVTEISVEPIVVDPDAVVHRIVTTTDVVFGA